MDNYNVLRNVVVHPMTSFLIQLEEVEPINKADNEASEDEAALERERLSEMCIEYLHLHRQISKHLAEERYDFDTSELNGILEDPSKANILPTFLYCCLLFDR